MSILKQMEEAKLTPEEIQELVTLLADVLPKIEKKVNFEASQDSIIKNLKEKLGGGGIQTESLENDIKQKSKIAHGYNLLCSAKTKLKKFIEVIEG